jgi:hypothetical protein
VLLFLLHSLYIATACLHLQPDASGTTSLHSLAINFPPALYPPHCYQFLICRTLRALGQIPLNVCSWCTTRNPCHSNWPIIIMAEDRQTDCCIRQCAVNWTITYPRGHFRGHLSLFLLLPPNILLKKYTRLISARRVLNAITSC